MQKLLTIACIVLLAMTMNIAMAQEASDIQGSDCEYFDVTGYELCGEFYLFWSANGGIPVFGYPLTSAFEEVNPDTGETYLVQYFERQRFELHPEHAGTPYHVLLGRLGAQLLPGSQYGEETEREAVYTFPETGLPVSAPIFAFWSSHGLDLGDPGVSFRESLALFGYPISGLRMETNADGDSVLTQWFERAVFELHPRDKGEDVVLLRRVGAEVLAMPSPDIRVIASGLNSPRGMVIGAGGALYIAEAGSGGDDCIVIDEGPAFGDNELCFGLTGSVSRVFEGHLERIATGLPSYRTAQGQVIGPQGVALDDNGVVYVTVGYALHPEHQNLLPAIAADMGYLVRIESDGSWTRLADLAAYELAVNPEPEGGIHSNPYGLLWVGDGFAVTDAAGNDLLHVNLEGEITTLAAFAPQVVVAPPQIGLPEGSTMQMASVPSGVAQGPDGALYVGEVTGFPFVPGMARIWRVAPGEEPQVYATGLTAVIDVGFDAQGNLYALEAVRGGLLGVNSANPETMEGELKMISPGGDHEGIVTEGLTFPTSFAIDAGGMFYITNFGMVPQQGTVVGIEQ